MAAALLRCGRRGSALDSLFGRRSTAPAHADEDDNAVLPRQIKYASPLEVLVSPDGARLYVLCQQSETVRVLDAASYAPIKTHPGGTRPARALRFLHPATGSS